MDKKLILNIENIELKSKETKSTSSFDELKRDLESLPMILKLFQKIDIERLKVGDNEFKIILDEDTLYLDNKFVNISSKNGSAKFVVKIPLGAVTGSEVFAGMGPEIPVTVRMTGGAEAQITDEFTSAGINQTRHRVMLKVECSVYVFLGGNEGAANFSDEYCIAENIVVGTVPQTAVTIDIPQRQ